MLVGEGRCGHPTKEGFNQQLTPSQEGKGRARGAALAAPQPPQGPHEATPDPAIAIQAEAGSSRAPRCDLRHLFGTTRVAPVTEACPCPPTGPGGFLPRAPSPPRGTAGPRPRAPPRSRTSHVPSPCRPRGVPCVPSAPPGCSWCPPRPLLSPPAQEAAPGPAAPAASRGGSEALSGGEEPPAAPPRPRHCGRSLLGTGTRSGDGVGAAGGDRDVAAAGPGGLRAWLALPSPSRAPLSPWFEGQWPPGTQHVPKPPGCGDTSTAGKCPQPPSCPPGWPRPAPRHHHKFGDTGGRP